MEKTIDSLLLDYNNNLFVKLSKIDNISITIYLTVIIIALFFAQKNKISITFIFFLAIGIFISYLIYKKREINDISKQKEQKIKIDMIIPKPKRLDKYPDLVNFLYNIREFYYINPSSFYSLVSNIDQFIQLYEQLMYDKMIYCTQNLEVANNFIKNAQNYLHSIIYNLDTDKNITKKYHQSMKSFHIIINQYKKRMISKCNSKFVTDELNVHSKYYEEYGPREINYFDNSNTFEFY